MAWKSQQKVEVATRLPLRKTENNPSSWSVQRMKSDGGFRLRHQKVKTRLSSYLWGMQRRRPPRIRIFEDLEKRKRTKCYAEPIEERRLERVYRASMGDSPTARRPHRHRNVRQKTKCEAIQRYNVCDLHIIASPSHWKTLSTGIYPESLSSSPGFARRSLLIFYRNDTFKSL